MSVEDVHSGFFLSANSRSGFNAYLRQAGLKFTQLAVCNMLTQGRQVKPFKQVLKAGIIA
jgi:hypothetical protein